MLILSKIPDDDFVNSDNFALSSPNWLPYYKILLITGSRTLVKPSLNNHGQAVLDLLYVPSTEAPVLYT